MWAIHRDDLERLYLLDTFNFPSLGAMTHPSTSFI